MTKTIVFHRHGETLINRHGQDYIQAEQFLVTLTETGIQQAQSLGEALQRLAPFDCYLSSPYPRAVQTATLVQTYVHQQFTIEPDLIDNTDDREASWKRVCSMAENLLTLPYERILLSTHGFVCDALSMYFKKDRTLFNIFSDPHHCYTKNCAYGIVEVDHHNHVTNIQHNITTHLEKINVLSISR